MTNKEFWEKNLEFNTILVEKLEPFSDRKVSELPDVLKAGLQKIKVGPRITTSGLESVYSLLGELYLINASLRQAIKDPVGFMKMYGGKNEGTNELKNLKTEELKNPLTEDRSKKEEVRNQISDNQKPTTPLRQGFAGQANNTPPPASKIEL